MRTLVCASVFMSSDITSRVPKKASPATAVVASGLRPSFHATAQKSIFLTVDERGVDDGLLNESPPRAAYHAGSLCHMSTTQPATLNRALVRDLKRSNDVSVSQYTICFWNFIEGLYLGRPVR